MKTQADLGSFGQQKSFWNLSSEPQQLCQYKFYPTYLTAKAIQMKVEDIKCNEAASRFTVENRTELQQRGLVGWYDYALWQRVIFITVGSNG